MLSVLLSVLLSACFEIILLTWEFQLHSWKLEGHMNLILYVLLLQFDNCAIIVVCHNFCFWQVRTNFTRLHATPLTLFVVELAAIRTMSPAKRGWLKNLTFMFIPTLHKPSFFKTLWIISVRWCRFYSSTNRELTFVVIFYIWRCISRYIFISVGLYLSVSRQLCIRPKDTYMTNGTWIKCYFFILFLRNFENFSSDIWLYLSHLIYEKVSSEQNTSKIYLSRLSAFRLPYYARLNMFVL